MAIRPINYKILELQFHIINNSVSVLKEGIAILMQKKSFNTSS